ncbi:hypothetical protein [Parvibaculum sp.]|uniref:hypothetical protein n=1 Tax=Parvibaculum sp. TaxID=2024848 RepID=UPI00349FDB4A
MRRLKLVLKDRLDLEKVDEMSDFLARECPQQHTIVRFDGRISILMRDDSKMDDIRGRYADLIEEVRDVY